MRLMSFRQVLVLFLTVCFVCLIFSACVVRRRSITQKGASRSHALKVANRDMLVQALARQYAAIKDFSATVDMVPALGSAEKSKITEYKDVRAFVLYRAPQDIRLIGLYPVVRTKAFDMVSNGLDFKLYLPSQSRFITGRNEIQQISKNKIENLRPQHFLEALMVRPVEPRDKLLVENFTDEDNAYYILQLVRENGSELRLHRTIWFNRIDLLLARELVFDASGNILTDARYSQWKAYDNVPFPKHVEINRPIDEYGVVMDVVKMDINKGLTDDKFALDQPEGTKLQVLGQTQ
jgi:outer membrane lipoprotein-sorting protein